MAITGSIALSSSTVYCGQPTSATVTLTNSGTSPVTVRSASTMTTAHGVASQAVNVATGVIQLPPGNPVVVPPNNGTVSLTWLVVPNSPQLGQGVIPETPLTSPYYLQFDVGCSIQTSDGSLTTPTVAVLTSNCVSLTPYGQYGGGNSL